MTDDLDERLPAPPSLYSLDKSVAVLRTELRGFMTAFDKRLDTLDTTVTAAVNRYATKDDLKERDEAIADIRRNITWGVRIVISAVILSVLAIVFKTGVLHG